MATQKRDRAKEENQMKEMDNLMKTCLEILSPQYVSPRKQRQLDLEQDIVDFEPDCDEAKELLDALVAALGNKIGVHRMVVVDEEARALRIAIGEAEPCEISEEDLKYDARVQETLDQ